MVRRLHQRLLLIKAVPTRIGQGVTCAGLGEEELRQWPPWPWACCVGRGADGMGDTRTPCAAFLETARQKLVPLEGCSLWLRQLHALRPFRPRGASPGGAWGSGSGPPGDLL